MSFEINGPAGVPRSRRFDELALGQSETIDVRITAAAVDEFARLSGDTNPLHMDAGEALASGFPRRVAHGMMALSAVSALIGTKLPGPGALWISQDVQFSAPVFVGDTIRVSVTIERLSAAARLVVLLTEAVSLVSGAVVLTGRAQVKVLDRSEREERVVTERVALVTGSSRGLGRAIAMELARTRHHVVVHYQTRQESAQEVVEAISAGDTRAVACQADLREPSGADRLFEEAVRAFGRVDVIVNNATPSIERRPALECEWADFSVFLDVYVRSAFRLVQLAAPSMKERKFGRVINVLSTYAHGVPPARLAPYVTAKSALAGLSRALAVELGAFGVTVNMVAPSMLVTEQTAGAGDRARQLAAAQAPLKRLPDLPEVAAAVGFLASDAASAITGAVLPVASGEIMPA